MKMTLEEAESKLTAIAKLPEKWRKYEEWTENNSGFPPGMKGYMKLCAKDLEYALEATRSLESLPNIAITYIESMGSPFPELDAHNSRVAAMINTPPVPAGKLSDKELGEIGAKAIKGCVHWSDINATFAAAVREQVEKEKAEEIARLTAELEACDQARKNACDDRDAARAELAKANAELERMQWRPVSVKPTREDADEGGFVTVLRADKLTAIVQWDANGFNPDFDWRQISQALRYTKWRAAALPPSPSAEEVQRLEFEKACVQFDVSFTRDSSGKYGDSRTLILFEVWMLALASAESKTLTQQEERK